MEELYEDKLLFIDKVETKYPKKIDMVTMSTDKASFAIKRDEMGFYKTGTFLEIDIENKNDHIEVYLNITDGENDTNNIFTYKKISY
jgi:hypothetical protein